MVFLIALPLNLGIAMASGAPLEAGIISGIIGGVVVGFFSGSSVSVSGPAAGLTLLVSGAIENLKDYNIFLSAVVLAGLLQIAFGLFRVGWIALFFPSSVIKGMLTAIGIVIILKQIPHLLGLDTDAFGEMSFSQKDGQNTFSEIIEAFTHIEPGPLLISLISILLLLFWQHPTAKKFRFFKVVPGPLAVVGVGIGLKWMFDSVSFLTVGKVHLVDLPAISDFGQWMAERPFPDFSRWTDKNLWSIAATLAFVAGLETLLSVEATDKIDPLHRVTPKNRELWAQGIGNLLTGLLGGIPLSAVVVRSSANIDAGAHSKFSAVFHGVLLAFCFFFISRLLNQIPLSALAAILLFTGYKLTRPIIFRSYFRLAKNQYIPFLITIAAILVTDLLIGMVVGLVVGLYFILKAHYQTPFHLEEEPPAPESGALKVIIIHLGEIVSFLNKSHFRHFLDDLPSETKVIIDGSHTRYMDQDVLEMIHEFKHTAREKNIFLEMRSLPRYRRTYS